MAHKVSEYFAQNACFVSSGFYWRRYSFGKRGQKQGGFTVSESEKVPLFRFHVVSRYLCLLYLAAGDTLRVRRLA